MSNPAIAYVGDYSFLLSDLDSNNKKRYVLAYQRGKAVLDKELTEQSYRDLDFLKRYLEKNIGDCALASSFKIAQSSITTVSNFKITGGTTEKPAILVVKGYPLVLFGDIEYNQQDATGSLTDDDYTQTTIPAISVPVADRIDTVYVDTYLAEVSCEAGSEYLDTSIKDVDLSIQTANRFRVVQDILVAENTTSIPADGYDINNVYHRYLKLAQIQRHAGNANILTADITDSRKVVSTLESISDGTGDINVKNAIVQDDLTVHGVVTIIDETHTHSEKLVITCDTASVDAITINKSNTGQAIVINKTDNGDGIVVNKTTGSGYAIVVNTGTVKLPNGTDINEFSTDTTLGGNSDYAVPTEKAVKTYVDASIGGAGGTTNRLAKFTGPHTVGDSNVSDDGTITSVNESYFIVTKDDALEVTATVNNTNDTAGKSAFIVDCNFGGDYKSLTLTQYNTTTAETALGTDASGAAVISSNDSNTALYIEQRGAKPIYIGNDGEIRITITDSGSVNVIGHLGVNMNSLSNSMDLWGMAVFYDAFGRVTINDGPARSSALTIEGIADYLSCILLASGNYFEDRKFAFNLTDWSLNNFYISRFDDSGNQLDSNVNPTFLIERSTGFIGINTSTFRGDPLESLLTLYKDNTIRILGEQGTYNYGGTIFFGDGYNVFLKEYQDDYLEILATQGYYFSGGPVGIGTEPDVSYKLLTSGSSRFFTDTKAVNICDDSSKESAIVTQYLKDNPVEYVDSSMVIPDYSFPASTIYVNDSSIYSTGETIRLSSSGTLPSPFSVDIDYFIIIYSANHIQLASSFEDAINSLYIIINDQGTGTHEIIQRQVLTKHWQLDLSKSLPSELWNIGTYNAGNDPLLNTVVGHDFCISRFDDLGNKLDSIYSRTFLINRSTGFVGINVREAQYPLDVNGSARFGNNDFGASVYAAGFFASGQYSSTNIGDWWRYFDYGFISEFHTSSIRTKTIGEGSIDGALLADLSTSDGQFITAGYYDGSNMMKHWSLSVDPYNPISSRRWSWSLQGITGSKNTNANLYLYNHHNSGNENDVVMSFRRSTGYVGIGVTSPGYQLDTTTGNFSSQVRTPLLFPVGTASIGNASWYFTNGYIFNSTMSSISAAPLSVGGDGYLKIINAIDGSKSLSTVTGQAGLSGVPGGAHIKHWCFVANPTGVFAASNIRWSFGVLDIESGSNAGSNFALWRHNDAGSEIDSPILINRSTGVVTIGTAYFSNKIATNRIESFTPATMINFGDDAGFDSGKKWNTNFLGQYRISTNESFYEKTRSRGLGYWWIWIESNAADWANVLQFFQVTTTGSNWVGRVNYLRITYVGLTAIVNGILTYFGAGAADFMLRYVETNIAFTPNTSDLSAYGTDPTVGSCFGVGSTLPGNVSTRHFFGVPPFDGLKFTRGVSFNPAGGLPGEKVAFCATYPLNASEPFLP